MQKCRLTERPLLNRLCGNTFDPVKKTLENIFSKRLVFDAVFPHENFWSRENPETEFGRAKFRPNSLGKKKSMVTKSVQRRTAA